LKKQFTKDAAIETKHYSISHSHYPYEKPMTERVFKAG